MNVTFEQYLTNHAESFRHIFELMKKLKSITENFSDTDSNNYVWAIDNGIETFIPKYLMEHNLYDLLKSEFYTLPMFREHEFSERFFSKTLITVFIIKNNNIKSNIVDWLRTGNEVYQKLQTLSKGQTFLFDYFNGSSLSNYDSEKSSLVNTRDLYIKSSNIFEATSDFLISTVLVSVVPDKSRDWITHVQRYLKTSIFLVKYFMIISRNFFIGNNHENFCEWAELGLDFYNKLKSPNKELIASLFLRTSQEIIISPQSLRVIHAAKQS